METAVTSLGDLIGQLFKVIRKRKPFWRGRSHSSNHSPHYHFDLLLRCRPLQRFQVRVSDLAARLDQILKVASKVFCVETKRAVSACHRRTKQTLRSVDVNQIRDIHESRSGGKNCVKKIGVVVQWHVGALGGVFGDGCSRSCRRCSDLLRVVIACAESQQSVCTKSLFDDLLVSDLLAFVRPIHLKHSHERSRNGEEAGNQSLPLVHEFGQSFECRKGQATKIPRRIPVPTAPQKSHSLAREKLPAFVGASALRSSCNFPRPFTMPLSWRWRKPE